MKQLLISSRTIAWFFLLLMALAFWGICTNTPFMNDDYWLLFAAAKAPDGSVYCSTTPIASWGDFLHSCLLRREFINGRFSDVLYTMTIWLGGKPLFDILNTLAMVVNVCLLAKLTFRRADLLSFSVVLFGFILLIPRIEGTVFWAAGACNYFWVTMPFCVFLLCLEKIMAGSFARHIIVLGSLAGFLCGALHEGIGVPLAGGLVSFWLMERIRGKKLPVPYICLAFFTISGCLLPLTAPALWIRVDHLSYGIPRSVGALLDFIRGPFATFMERMGIPMLALAVCFWKKSIRLHSPIGWVLIIVSCLTFHIASRNVDGGCFYYMALCIMLMVLNASAEWWSLHARKAVYILVPILCVCFAGEYFHMKEINGYYQGILASPKEKGVCVVDYPDGVRDIPFALFASVPLSRHSHLYPYCGKIWKQDDFLVYFRRKGGIDSKYYDAFEGLSDTEAHIRLCDGRYVIRSPKNTAQTSPRPLWLCSLGKRQKCLENVKRRGFLHKMGSLFKDERVGSYTEDWHDGCLYLLLPPDISEYDQIEVEFVEDTLFSGQFFEKKNTAKRTKCLFNLP